MNGCRHVRELILTDYADGETDAAVTREVTDHLAVCPACRMFAAQVERDLIRPFEKAGREEVPPEVWLSIKETIESRAVPPDPSGGLWKRLTGQRLFPRLAPVFASVLLMFLAGTTIFYVQRAQQAQAEKQGEYLASLLVPSGFQQPEGSNPQTPIEEYFL